MDASPVAGDTITTEWCAHAFDHLSPELGSNLHTTMDYMRANHPVARSEQYGGFWVLSKYEDVLKVAQDWETFSSAHGVTVPSGPTSMPAIPEMIDPPLHREYKRLINFYFRPPEVLQQEEATRELVTQLIDGFIEAGSCDFMTDFARPLPGMVFFTEFLHAPGGGAGGDQPAVHDRLDPDQQGSVRGARRDDQVDRRVRREAAQPAAAR